MAAMGQEEKDAVLRVLDSGVLSGFLAGQLHGGPEVTALEAEWAAYFGFKHAVAMNSATSCLIAACGAVGVGHGEVIVPPLTMSATAACVLPWGADPVFVDIEPDYFCLNPAKLSDYFSLHHVGPHFGPLAIITVDLFGQASNPDIKTSVADYKYLVPIIQDASQRPLPKSAGGVFGDIVVHSLNYHKHIHCGEGGLACTDDDRLADRLRAIRNHGENTQGFNGYGFNFRMTEIEAAIARVQLKKLPGEIARRQAIAKTLPTLAPVRPGCEHAWYLYPHLAAAPETFQYAPPLYRLPLFQEDAAKFPDTEAVWETLRVSRP